MSKPLQGTLTSFATVDEVRAALPEITVGNIEFAVWNMIPSMHDALSGATGQSTAIVYVGGELQIHDNPLGVFTNAPAFDGHMTNLCNSIGILPKLVETVNLNDMDLDGTEMQRLTLDQPQEFVTIGS